MSVEVVKQELLAKLKQENCFWSYNESSINNVSDEILNRENVAVLGLGGNQPAVSYLFI